MPIEIEIDGHGVLEFPDGTDEAVIRSAVQRVTGGSGGDVAPKAPERTWTDTAVDALPMIGGSLGGLLGMAGGPATAIGGAALGGAGGEAWRQNLNRLRGKEAPSSAGEAAQSIALRGAGEGAAEAVGGGAGWALKKGGRAIYRGLLKPSQALRDDFGGGDALVDTLIREGATISGKGAQKVRGAMASSREKALQIVQDAAGADDIAPVTSREVARGLSGARKTLRARKAVGQPDKTGAVRERITALADSMHGSPVPVSQAVTFAREAVPSAGPQSFTSFTVPAGATRLKAVPGPVTSRRVGDGVDVVRAQAMKETAQDAASGAYRMVARGQKAQIGAKGLLDEGTARGLRRAIEKRVPMVASQNRRTQELLGGTRALEAALEARANNNAIGGARDLIATGVGAGAMAGAGGPAGLTAGLLTRLLASPRAGSAIAIGMDRTGRNVPIDDLIRALELIAQEQQ